MIGDIATNLFSLTAAMRFTMVFLHRICSFSGEQV